MGGERTGQSRSFSPASQEKRSPLDCSRGTRPGTNDLYIGIVEIVGSMMGQGKWLGSRQKG